MSADVGKGSIAWIAANGSAGIAFNVAIVTLLIRFPLLNTDIESFRLSQKIERVDSDGVT